MKQKVLAGIFVGVVGYILVIGSLVLFIETLALPEESPTPWYYEIGFLVFMFWSLTLMVWSIMKAIQWAIDWGK